MESSIDPDLTVNICGVRLSNPLILASGIKGKMSAPLLAKYSKDAGAITTKSCNLKGRKGHPPPTIWIGKPAILNAAGLPNDGVDSVIKEIRECRKISDIPIIASVFENSVEGFGEVASRISEAEPDLIEIDMSCPNVQEERVMFSDSCQSAGEVIRKIKKVTKIPIIAKLSPAVSNIAEIALECERAGADAICAINTMPAMEIDPIKRAFVLSNKFGGMSGPCLKPIALRCVYQIRKAVRIPIIGTGGIETGEDCARFFLAGANAVGIGSVLYFDQDAFSRIKNELSTYMKKMNFTKISDIKM
ncbi:MAG: dihydroorotate dehydrogenase [Candidatus Anstonellales archaeon]